MKFPAKARLIRILRGMTQQELADCIEIDRTAVGRYEVKDLSPKIDILNKYSSALHVPVGTLTQNERFYAVFRPISPWHERQVKATMRNLIRDIHNMLPAFAVDQGIDSYEWFDSEVGSILVMRGNEAGFFIICTKDLADALKHIPIFKPSDKIPTKDIPDLAFVEIFINPIAGLHLHQALFDGLVEHMPDIHCLYPPPTDAVQICVDVSGMPHDKDKITEIVKQLFHLYKTQITKVEFPEKPDKHLPVEVNTWITSSGLRIQDGKLV